MNTIRQIIPANNKVAKFKDSNGEVYCIYWGLKLKEVL